MAFRDKGIRSLETARECALLGAHQRTIAWMTGLPPTFILRNVFDKANPAPCGRPRYTEDFAFRAPLRIQAAASAFAVKYLALTGEGFAPAQSLISAFRHYRCVAEAFAFNFDEAFFLICNLAGLWACTTRKLQVTRCRCCGSKHLAPYGALPEQGCSICRSIYGHDAQHPGAGNHRNTSGARSVSQGFIAHVGALKTRRALSALGAHTRVINALMSTMEELPARFRPLRPTDLVRIGKPLPLRSWGTGVRISMQIQYSAAATAYQRLIASGFRPEDAVIGTYRHVRHKFQNNSPLTFDRCFEVLSLLEGRWGSQRQELDLVACSKCFGNLLVSRRDSTSPACPFCLLIRHPEKYFRSVLPARSNS